MEIRATSKTPHIIYQKDINVVEIFGRSIPENAYDFYKPLLDELQPNITVIFDLDYANSSSRKLYMDVFKQIQNSNSKVIWYYSDEDMLELGENYKSFFGSKILFTILPNVLWKEKFY